IITSQKRQDRTLLRKKPVPAYRYTLLQAYQRWLYQDYAYLWTQQTSATQRTYHSLGGRHHMTGFAYWMKIMLKTMPDRLGWWTLDATAGAIAHDRTPNLNHGTIVGATQEDGLIDGGLGFDGINNVVNIPGSASLYVETPITIEALAKPDNITSWGTIIGKRTGGISNFYFRFQFAEIQFHFANAGWNIWRTNTAPISALTWLHCVVTYDGIIDPIIYIDAVPRGAAWAGGARRPLLPDLNPAYLGRAPTGDPFAGI
ncbi:unnamed protein product, partial [marine sediment metagenome]